MADISLWGTLLTAAGSILAGGATGYVTSRIKARETIEAWIRSRSDLADGLAVDHFKDTVTAIAAAGHSQCWLTWRACYDPAHFTRADIERYDAEMHQLLPRMWGGQAALASFNPEVGEAVGRAVQLITAEDAFLGLASVSLEKGGPAALGARQDSAVETCNRALELCTNVGARLLKVRREAFPAPLGGTPPRP